MSINGVEHIRQVNLGVVLRLLHVVGPLSRSELGSRLGLTRSTTGQLVADLANQGLVLQEVGVPSGIPGRPSSVVYPNSRGVAVASAQIEVGSIAAALVGLGGERLLMRRVAHDPGRLGPEETAQDIARLLRELLVDAPPECRLAGLGIAVCGIVRRSDGLVRRAPNLGWRDVAIVDMVRSSLRLPVPTVAVNDADASALAEHARGAGAGTRTMAFVGGEAGVGAGIIVDGRLLEGASTSAGELGHWPLNPRGRPCSCGSVGCWETEASQRALLRRVEGPERPPYQDAVRRTLEAARRGDPRARRAVRETAFWLGVGLAGVVNVFDPERIVLGGSFFTDLLSHARDHIQLTMQSRAMLGDAGDISLVGAQLGGEDAALVGAAEAAFSPLLSNPWRSILTRAVSHTDEHEGTEQGRIVMA